MLLFQVAPLRVFFAVVKPKTGKCDDSTTKHHDEETASLDRNHKEPHRMTSLDLPSPIMPLTSRESSPDSGMVLPSSELDFMKLNEQRADRTAAKRLMFQPLRCSTPNDVSPVTSSFGETKRSDVIDKRSKTAKASIRISKRKCRISRRGELKAKCAKVKYYIAHSRKSERLRFVKEPSTKITIPISLDLNLCDFNNMPLL